jgi:hypothetical protein
MAVNEKTADVPKMNKFLEPENDAAQKIKRKGRH